MSDERRTNPAMQFLKTYWFLILFTFGAMGTVANLYFEVTFMSRMLNPDTLIEYNREQAIKDTKTEIYRCLSTLMHERESGPKAFLECAK